MSYKHRLGRITWKRLPLFCLLVFVLEMMPVFSGAPFPIPLRAGPSEQHAIVATVPPTLFLELTVSEEQGEWAKVRVASGQEGWLRLGALGAGAPASSAGFDRSPAPTSPAVPPTPPGADRPSHSGPMPPSTLPAGMPSPIPLRAGPGEQHAIVATVPPTLFLELTVSEEQGEWAKVRVASGQEGWLRLGALGAGAPASSAGFDRSPAPTSPAVPPTPPGADRPSHSGPMPPSTLPAGMPSPIPLRAGPGEQHAIVATVPPTLFLELTVERGAGRVGQGTRGERAGRVAAVGRPWSGCAGVLRRVRPDHQPRQVLRSHPLHLGRTAHRNERLCLPLPRWPRRLQIVSRS